MVTIRHEHSPEAIRGRVFSTYSAVAMAAQPLGVLVAGNLVEGTGFGTAVAALALYGLALAVVLAVLSSFRHMEAPAADQPTAPCRRTPRLPNEGGSGSAVTNDIDDLSTRRAHEEAAHAPRLVG